jgi:SAM-dependent methyltransferase
MPNFLKTVITRVRIKRRVLRNLATLPLINDIDDWIKPYLSISEQTATLDLGCGVKPKNPFYAHHVFGVDFAENLTQRVLSADLAIQPIPHPNSRFDFITAFDFIEHIPRVAYVPQKRFPFVELLDEVWRVLKPGGLFLSHTPIYPFVEAFQDPTHVNIITSNTLRDYFCGDLRIARMYGFRGNFNMEAEALKGSHLVSILRKVDIE